MELGLTGRRALITGGSKGIGRACRVSRRGRHYRQQCGRHCRRRNGERWYALTAKLPFGRPARPEGIANMVAFLASDLSAYATGTVATIDGGLANGG